MVQRRSFLKKVGATGIALSTPIVGQSRATIDIRNHLENTASMSGFDIDSKSDATTTFVGYEGKAEPFMNQSSTLTIREVYHTDLYGWEARVGLTSTAVSALSHRSGSISSTERIEETGFKFTNSSDAPPDFNPPDPDEGFRGFSKNASTSGDPKLPGWVEPVFDTTVSSMVALSTSNPWTGVAAGIALSANNIVNALKKDEGKTQLDRGFKYRHVHKESALFGWTKSRAPTNKLSHYQRATLKMGDTPVLGHVNVDARFGEHSSTGPEIGFEVNLGTCELCGDVEKDAAALATSTDTIVDMSNPTPSQKERFGIVSVSDGTVDDQDVKSKASVNRRVEQIANSVEGRKVDMVALNPPTAIKSTKRSRTGDQSVPKTGQPRPETT